MSEKRREPSSWTDDLPVCKNSGIGSATNQIYREDGIRQEEHPFEDRSCHWTHDISTDNKIFFYAVFDGHDGPKAADFCLQRMAAEILLGQLTEKKTDEEVKELLRQAFVFVEKGYMDSIDDLLAERTNLQCDMPDGLSTYEVYQKYPKVMDKIDAINDELRSGTAATIVLIFNDKLYVANVGNSRVLLCRTDENDVHVMRQLTVDHDLQNEDELLRLQQLGVDVERLKNGTCVGNREITRCLGNYLIKGGFRDIEELAKAVTEPIIAEPEILGGIPIDDSCKFLLLMTAGLHKSLLEATDTDQVNKTIIQYAIEQFKEQSTLNGVAQAMVDKIVRMHHDSYTFTPNLSSAKREDITLLVRNFNYNMPTSCKSHMSSASSTVTSTRTSTDATVSTNDTTSNSSSVENSMNYMISEPDNKIMPYVDFSCYYDNVKKLRDFNLLPDGIDYE